MNRRDRETTARPKAIGTASGMALMSERPTLKFLGKISPEGQQAEERALKALRRLCILALLAMVGAALFALRGSADVTLELFGDKSVCTGTDLMEWEGFRTGDEEVCGFRLLWDDAHAVQTNEGHHLQMYVEATRPGIDLGFLFPGYSVFQNGAGIGDADTLAPDVWVWPAGGGGWENLLPEKDALFILAELDWGHSVRPADGDATNPLRMEHVGGSTTLLYWRPIDPGKTCAEIGSPSELELVPVTQPLPWEWNLANCEPSACPGTGEDNCTARTNIAQIDTDGDGFGNVCDCDFDQNGGCGASDLAALRADYLEAVPPADPDVDMWHDLAIGAADLNLFSPLFFGPPGPTGCE